MKNEQRINLSNANQNQVYNVHISHVAESRLAELLLIEYRFRQIKYALQQMGMWEDVVLISENPDKYL